MIKWERGKHYYWPDVFSRQVGTNGEIAVISGGKGIGKTFGLRLQCVEDFLRRKVTFCEICRTKTECAAVQDGYFSKLQNDGFYTDYDFKCEKNAGYINLGDDDNPEWELICYFVALSNFQQEKKRTFVKPYRFIFDEAIIDTKDRYHRYLNSEFLILANLLDSVSRQQPGEDYQYRLYILGNSVDLSSPYFQYLGIDSIPEFGFTWYRDKTVLLHYVEPFDAEQRKAQTLVGRMLAGSDEARIIFDNEFADVSGGEVMPKTPNAKYKYALIYDAMKFGIWVDSSVGLYFVTSKIPINARNVYTLTKRDGTVNYAMLRKTDSILKILNQVFYVGGLRYESMGIRQAFHDVLGFLGIK